MRNLLGVDNFDVAFFTYQLKKFSRNKIFSPKYNSSTVLFVSGSSFLILLSEKKSQGQKISSHDLFSHFKESKLPRSQNCKHNIVGINYHRHDIGHKAQLVANELTSLFKSTKKLRQRSLQEQLLLKNLFL